MADFAGAKQIDLTPQALAMIRLAQAGQSMTSDSQFTGRFGPGFPPMPVEPEVRPRLFQYQPGTNLMMVPRMGYASLPFATLRAMAGACKEIRINIEHIKRIMRGVDWDIVPNDKKKVVVGSKTYVATPETESVKKFFSRPDGVNLFDTWLNMVLEEVLVTDALTFWPVQERGQELEAIEIIDGATIKPLLDMRGGTPRPPVPAYLQIIHGTPQSSYPANTLIYRPLNTKVNTPYGESPIEWILTAINTAIRKDLSAVGYYAEGNIPGAFYTVPEGWTPEQISTFQSYIDALMAGDLARFAKLLAVPGGTGSHVTTFQQNDPDNPALNEYLMKVACWAFGNNPAEFGITGGAGLGGAGFMQGSENIQQRSLIGPVSSFLAGIFTEIIHDWMKRPDLRFAWTGLEPVEDRSTQATADTANINMGVYTVSFVQDRDGIPQEYRPALNSPASPAKVGAGTLPMPLPPEYERYLKAALGADLKKWEEKALRSLKKGWTLAPFTSEIIPADLNAEIAARLAKAKNAEDIKAAFVVDARLHKHQDIRPHKSGEGLHKRDEQESAMSEDLKGYFDGLTSRIADAITQADGAVSRVMNGE